MIDQELQRMERVAVDLDTTKNWKAEQAARRLREEGAQRAAEDQFRRWTRVMNRAFKGIVSAPERARRVEKAVARHG